VVYCCSRPQGTIRIKDDNFMNVLAGICGRCERVVVQFQILPNLKKAFNNRLIETYHAGVSW
jgi:hypothetical protein